MFGFSVFELSFIALLFSGDLDLVAPNLVIGIRIKLLCKVDYSSIVTVSASIRPSVD